MRTLQSFLLVGVVCTAAALLPGCSSSTTPSTGGAGASAGGATGTAGATNHAGAGGATGTAGAAGAGTAGGTSLMPGDIARGKAAYNAPAAGSPAMSPGGACYTCHGANGEGQHGPNITGATGTALGSGIGGWTEQQFHDAVRLAKWKDGTPLCLLMAPVPATGAASASDQDIADMYAYLMSLNTPTALQGDYCATGSPTGK